MRGRRRLAGFCVLCGAFLFPQAGRAEFKGELNIEGRYTANSGNSLDAALGRDSHEDLFGWLRLMWSGELASGWSLDTAYFAEVQYGGGSALPRRFYEGDPGFFVDARQSALLPLQQTLADHGDIYAAQRLDRLALSYSGPHLVLRVGRQALTWGGGLLFHPMDLFNPFSPNATYTRYKPGADMLYGQWLFDSGADVQGVVVGRRNPVSGEVSASDMSGGAKWHGFAGEDQQYGIDLMLAQDYRSQALALSLAGPLAGASWTAEAIPTRLPDGNVKTSVLANLQYAWTWGSRSVNGFVEFYHNGFGVAGGSPTLTELPPWLIARLARGQIFTVSKNYLALGMDLAWTPLLHLKPSLIGNLDDGSTLLIGQAVYNLSQNIDFTGGFQWSRGGKGSEYGGIQTTPDSGVVLAPADWMYLRLTWYF